MAVSPQSVAVQLSGLSIHIGSRKLLDRAEARFEPDQVTLVVGPSGVGKSILLRVIAGLMNGESDPDIRATGDVLLDDEATRPSERRKRVGVVFQNFALFDELSPLDNVRLAASHRRSRPPVQGRALSKPNSASEDPPVPRTSKTANSCTKSATNGSGMVQSERKLEFGRRPCRPGPEQWLADLRVPCDVRTAALSGGQRQRLAIARTLAYQPSVVLYDEPTSGLDAATADQVAALIRDTHASHPTTSIVVTHDYEVLAPIADKIYLYDPKTAKLVEIQQAESGDLRERMKPVAVPDVGQEATTWRQRIARSTTGVVSRIGDFLATTARIGEWTLTSPLVLLPLWRSPFWGLRFLLHYLRLIAGPSAWLYIAVAGLIIGFVTMYFTFRFLPYALYTKPLLIEDLLMSIGFALYRILVPVLTTVLIAARCGAAVASDVGGKSYGRQLDAMRTLGASPRFYLLTPILYSFLLGAPLLEWIGYWTATATSLVVFTAMHPERGPDFWHLHYHRLIADPSQWLYLDFAWLLAKLLLCAAGIGLISYHRACRPMYSPSDVSRAITSTVLWATLYVLTIHFVFAFIEF